jgi:hypothetical protein
LLFIFRHANLDAYHFVYVAIELVRR